VLPWWQCIEDADDVRKEVQLMQQLRGHPNIIDLHETFEDSKVHHNTSMFVTVHHNTSMSVTVHTEVCTIVRLHLCVILCLCCAVLCCGALYCAGGVPCRVQHVHLVMELCKGGKLFDRIKLRGQYAERHAALVLATLVEALIYCHSNGIVHRDIKPENILLMKKEDDSVIKVIDFGVAARFRQGQPSPPLPFPPLISSFLCPLLRQRISFRRFVPFTNAWGW